MPGFSGPTSFAENNLVFSYDIGDINNCFRGKPTTNFINNPTSEGYSAYEFMQYADLAPIFNTYGLVPYSLSLDLRSTNTTSYSEILVYMQNGSSTKYAFVSQWVPVTTEFKRYKFEGLTPSISTPSDTAAMLAFYGVYGTGNNPVVKNVQVELGNIASPFVVGTRSTTQSMLNLTGANTINMSIMSFNSQGNPYFDGTDDYMYLSSGFANFTNGITLNVIAKFNSANGGWVRLFDFGNGAGSNNMLFCRYSDTNTLFFGLYPGGNSSYTIGGTIDFDQYAMYTATADGITYKIYKNGTLVHTTNNSQLLLDVTRNNNYIGRSNWADPYFNGEIPIAQIYNTAISANDIQGLYQNYKSRFNLN